MKPKLFLLLATILFAGMGMAHAQNCPEAVIQFPATFNVGDTFCIAAPNQAARLRWSNVENGVPDGRLQLFDTDDGGASLWCAHLHDGSTTCAQGNSLCLQIDGNAVIYSGLNCSGQALWSSKTTGDNVNGEVLGVGDGFPGEKVFIIRGFNTTNPIIVFTSSNSDPT